MGRTRVPARNKNAPRDVTSIREACFIDMEGDEVSTQIIPVSTTDCKCDTIDFEALREHRDARGKHLKYFHAVAQSLPRKPRKETSSEDAKPGRGSHATHTFATLVLGDPSESRETWKHRDTLAEIGASATGTYKDGLAHLKDDGWVTSKRRYVMTKGGGRSSVVSFTPKAIKIISNRKSHYSLVPIAFAKKYASYAIRATFGHVLSHTVGLENTHERAGVVDPQSFKLTVTCIANRNGLTTKTVRKWLAELQSLGLILKIHRGYLLADSALIPLASKSGNSRPSLSGKVVIPGRHLW